MSLPHRSYADARVLGPTGRLDHDNYEAFRADLAAKQAKTRNGRVLLAALQPLVGEIFKISRFNLLFEIFPSLREALAAVSAARSSARATWTCKSSSSSH